MEAKKGGRRCCGQGVDMRRGANIEAPNIELPQPQ